MDPSFAALVDNLPASLEKLLACLAHSGGLALATSVPARAVYLFSEGDDYLYVGRTNRLRQRYLEHCRGKHNDAPFAFKLSRHETGNLKEKGGRTRLALQDDLDFSDAFQKAKERVKSMAFRWVEVTDANEQCLFEIYATLTLKARFNDFENH
ncbi:hypothetical protein SAMN05518849_11833 [Sphingobium sp. AP50]|uniref:hypothetical protein n=1 Tax=Sphingobium sp. AP50 TaxID=1884369 RepID=UPI0008C01979|nr:hypothetical protein [Sphingobium sp. AP50]SEJ91686.1 hypothetical protein SAMN05518849_11833 [Sphingobium sp. AP50]